MKGLVRVVPEQGRPARLGRDAARVARFAAVGASGVAVNLGVLHLLATAARLPEVAASALAIEASIVWNFVLNDQVTFRDRRGGATFLARLLRFHAVAAVGFVVQLATFVTASALLARAMGRSEPGELRLVAQSLGIALAFSWNFVGSARFAWAAGAADERRAETLARAAPVALFGVLLLLHALPMWLVPRFPSQDGPLHVENVVALLHSHTPLLARYYVANWGAQPNWITQAMLAGLLRVLAPATAEKAILTGYVLLLPLAFRAALPRGTRGWWASLGVFPFVHAFPFQMGFWNFCWGLALCFAALAVWRRRRGRLSRGRASALAALVVLLFFAHLVAFAAFAVVVAAMLGWSAALGWRRSRGHPARRRLVLRGYAARAGAAAAVVAPGSALVIAWLAAHRSQASARIPLPELAAKLAGLYALVAVDRRELFLAAAVALAVAIAVVHLLLARASRPLRRVDGWLVAAAAFAALYFLVPDVVASGAYVSDRMALLAFLCALAWAGTGAAPLPPVRRAGIALAALAVLLLGVRVEKEREIARYVDEYLQAAEVVPPGSVMLPIAFSPHGPDDAQGRRLGYRTKPFLHVAGWIVAERGGVDLDNSQANTDQCPVRFREGRNPFRTIAPSPGAMEGAPPCLALQEGDPATGEPIPWVLVWGATPKPAATPCGRMIRADLEDGYERVFVSGMLEVWRPRGALGSTKKSPRPLGPGAS